MKYLSVALAWLKINRSKVIFFFASLVLWVFFLFPFTDLADWMGTKVAELTQNQIFLQFSNLEFSAWPVGVRLKDVNVDTAYVGPFEARELTLSPSLTSLFSKIPSGSLSAKGLFRGDVEISMKPGSKSESKLERQKIEIHASKINLQELRDLSQLPSLRGQLNLDANILTDLALAEAPEADILIKADKFELPSQTINTAMGPINIPDLRLSTLELKAHMAAGKIFIEDAKLGREGDEIRGTIKGDLMFSLKNQGGLQSQMGAYNIDVDLSIKSSLEEKLSLFLGPISQFKTPAGDSSRYRIRLNGQNSYMPPSLSQIQ